MTRPDTLGRTLMATLPRVVSCPTELNTEIGFHESLDVDISPSTIIIGHLIHVINGLSTVWRFSSHQTYSIIYGRQYSLQDTGNQIFIYLLPYSQLLDCALSTHFCQLINFIAPISMAAMITIPPCNDAQHPTSSSLGDPNSNHNAKGTAPR